MKDAGEAALFLDQVRTDYYLIREAIERAVDYDDWFIREVEKGLAQIAAGQVLTHDAVGARLEQKLTDHQSRR